MLHYWRFVHDDMKNMHNWHLKIIQSGHVKTRLDKAYWRSGNVGPLMNYSAVCTSIAHRASCDCHLKITENGWIVYWIELYIQHIHNKHQYAVSISSFFICFSEYNLATNAAMALITSRL